jgi:hypothetical protein
VVSACNRNCLVSRKNNNLEDTTYQQIDCHEKDLEGEKDKLRHFVVSISVSSTEGLFDAMKLCCKEWSGFEHFIK